MKIVVCMKHILDPELPPSSFEIEPEKKQAKIGKHAFVLNPYDENALEMALQLKEKKEDVQITALVYGETKAEESLRRALGVLADEAVHIVQETEQQTDAYGTAKVLAACINAIGPVDLIMCGRMAGDWDAGLVGSLLAEALALPSVCFISGLEIIEGRLRVSRQVEGGTEILESPLPVLVTVTNDESNVLRIAKVRDVMKAHRKPIQQYTLKDLDVSVSDLEQQGAYEELRDLYLPVQDNVCEIIEGEGPEEKIDALLTKLKAQKIL
jgi:electron transfer flavoprotein beta subunit